MSFWNLFRVKSSHRGTEARRHKENKEGGIGVQNESSLHRELKLRYAGQGGQIEVIVGDFIIDGLRKDGEYIEVQTGSFAPLAKKVKALAKTAKVRIIHPIAITKTIEVYKPNGEFLHRRKSPKKASIWNIFDALLHAPLLALTPNVTIELVLVEIIEKRIKDGKGGRRWKGKDSVHDKELTKLCESIILKKKADYLKLFIPFKKADDFTCSSLAKEAGINTFAAGRALYVLTKLKIVKRTGKKGNAWVYRRG